MSESKWQRRAHVSYTNRRKEVRDQCTGSVSLEILAPGPRKAISAKLLDVSSSGLRVGLPYFVTPGSFVRIQLSTAVAEGEVRQCVCETSEYLVGISIEEVVAKDADQGERAS